MHQVKWNWVTCCRYWWLDPLWTVIPWITYFKPTQWMPFNNNDFALMRASYRQWLPSNTGHKFANCNAELQLKSLYKLFKVSSARHAGYIVLTSFIVFAKTFCIVKGLKMWLYIREGWKYSRTSKCMSLKPSNFQIHLLLKSSKRYVLIHWLNEKLDFSLQWHLSWNYVYGDFKPMNQYLHFYIRKSITSCMFWWGDSSRLIWMKLQHLEQWSS